MASARVMPLTGDGSLLSSVGIFVVILVVSLMKGGHGVPSVIGIEQ